MGPPTSGVLPPLAAAFHAASGVNWIEVPDTELSCVPVKVTPELVEGFGVKVLVKLYSPFLISKTGWLLKTESELVWKKFLLRSDGSCTGGNWKVGEVNVGSKFVPPFENSEKIVPK